jgi:ferritin-like metal-binding protein YciE
MSAETRTKSQKGAGTENPPLADLFHHQLQDIYFAEKAITKALPKMIKGARSRELRSGFEKHLAQTEGHIRRLEQVFKSIGKKAEGTPCEAIKGILKEGDEIAEEFGETAAGDSGLAAAAQAVEHYEIARYGTLKAWAQKMDRSDVVELLGKTLEEERETDATLSKLSEGLNAAAMKNAA